MTKEIRLDFTEYLKTNTVYDICDIAAAELILGCPHVKIYDTRSELTLLEIDYTRNTSYGLLTEFYPGNDEQSYIWGKYCEKDPHIFDTLKNKNITVSEWMTARKTER